MSILSFIWKQITRYDAFVCAPLVPGGPVGRRAIILGHRVGLGGLFVSALALLVVLADMGLQVAAGMPELSPHRWWNWAGYSHWACHAWMIALAVVAYGDQKSAGTKAFILANGDDEPAMRVAGRRAGVKAGFMAYFNLCAMTLLWFCFSWIGVLDVPGVGASCALAIGIMIMACLVLRFMTFVADLVGGKTQKKAQDQLEHSKLVSEVKAACDRMGLDLEGGDCEWIERRVLASMEKHAIIARGEGRK